MNIKIPIRFVSYNFPILHVCDAIVHSPFPAVNQNFDLTNPEEVEKAISWAAKPFKDGLLGDVDAVFNAGAFKDVRKRWTKGESEDVANEFVVREMKLKGLKMVVLAMRQVLDLEDGCLPLDRIDCCVLDGEIREACMVWNLANTRLLHFYNEKRGGWLKQSSGKHSIRDTKEASLVEMLHQYQYFGSDGTYEDSSYQLVTAGQILDSMKIEPIEILPKRPKTGLVGIPPMSTVERVQKEIEKWQSVTVEGGLDDVEYLVALCNKSAPIGKKSWNKIHPGETPSLAQLYAHNYTQRKNMVVGTIRNALEMALKGNKFPPENATIVRARDSFEHWNALSKEVQQRIDQEIDRVINVSETFLPLSPERRASEPAVGNQLSQHTVADSPKHSWLSNDNKSPTTSRDEYPETTLEQPQVLGGSSSIESSKGGHLRDRGYGEDENEGRVISEAAGL